MKYRYEVYRLQESMENGLAVVNLIDYTDYFVMPFFYNGNLNQTLNVGEVLLDCAPISTKQDFPPKTKILVKRYDEQDNLVEYDLVVDNDYCEEYIGEPSLCSHKISCISPAVVAQGIHCDNIALTYKLQDVDLSYRVNAETGELVGSITGTESGSTTPLMRRDEIKVPDHTNYYETGYINGRLYYKSKFYFSTNYKYVWEDIDGLESLNKSTTVVEDVRIPNPKLVIKCGQNWEYSCQLNSKTEVILVKKDKNGVERDRILVETFINGPTSVEQWDIFSGGSAVSGENTELGLFYMTYPTPGKLYIRTIADNTEEIVGTMHLSPDPVKFINMPSIGFPPIAYIASNVSPTISFSKGIPTLEEEANGIYYEYQIVCSLVPTFSNIQYLKSFKTVCDSTFLNGGSGLPSEITQVTSSYDLERATISDLNISVFSGKYEDIIGGQVLKSGVQYNTYSFFQKAMQTTDTYFLENNESLDSLDEKFPIVVSNYWQNRMLKTTMFETILETKNLWEVFQEIGKYLHAEPDLRFHRDIYNNFTGRLELFYKELGGKKESGKTCQPLSIFNSQAIKQYYNCYDSYVENLFSPENIVTEVITPTSTDGSYIVSNSNAVFKLKYNVYEFIEIKIRYNQSGNSNWIDLMAKGFIFEKNIFSILTAEPNITPSKANSLYWSIGGDTIENLNYTPEKEDVYDAPLTAFKTIIGRIYSISENDLASLKYNDVQLLVKYRTQDSVRFSQFRPNMFNFVKNSPFEKYPHHEQFYNQLDKIPDSERFSTNMWGQLIKNGNNTYICDEFFIPDDNNLTEKKEGDMFIIDDKPYYVTTSENEYYNNCILQKITYSANWNNVAEITSINSEPRVYEVSERSMVRREIRLNEFIMLTTKASNRIVSPCPAIFLDDWADFIKKLVFNESDITLPNYAKTVYSNDGDPSSVGYRLFPSSEIERTGENSIKPVKSLSSSQNIVPLLNYPKKDGILFEWDMEDNFQAGEYFYEGEGTNIDNEAYYVAQPVRYCDISGKADRFKFTLFYLDPNAITIGISRTITLGRQATANLFAYSSKDIALNKDNREALSFNYQINLVYDDFITFNSLFAKKVYAGKLKLMLYKKTVGLFDQFLDFEFDKIIEDDCIYSFGQNGNELYINITKPTILGEDAYSLIWYEQNPENENNKIIYIAKNLTDQEKEQTSLTYYMYPTYNEN